LCRADADDDEIDDEHRFMLCIGEGRYIADAVAISHLTGRVEWYAVLGDGSNIHGTQLENSTVLDYNPSFPIEAFYAVVRDRCIHQGVGEEYV